MKRAADGGRQRSSKIIDEKRVKYRAMNESLWNTSTGLKRVTFVILKNHARASIRKGRSSPMSKARRKAIQNKFAEKGGVPDRVKSFGEVNSSKTYPRAQVGLLHLLCTSFQCTYLYF